MTDDNGFELLEDPQGAPYPEEIQVLARKLLDEALPLGVEVLTLVELVEAAKVLPVEVEVELDPVQEERLLAIFSSGFVSGISTHLINADHVPPHIAGAMAATVVGRIMSDPAFRHDTTADLVRLFIDGEAQAYQLRTAHVSTPHQHPEGPAQ